MSAVHEDVATGRALFDLTGEVALVTGGGRGIGRAIAEALAAHGAAVAVSGRSEETLRETVAAIEAGGGKASAHVCDVGEESDVERLREQVLEVHGRVDVLVNNAGIDPHYAPIERTDPMEWARIIEINLTGVFRCCRLIGSTMLEREHGSIINISSVAGRTGLAKQVPYCASKGGVDQLTKALAVDWAPRGIRVNAIAYAFVATDLTHGIINHEHIGKRLLARTPMGRFGRPDEAGGAAVFLASPAASYVTGTTLYVDGGWTAG